MGFNTCFYVFFYIYIGIVFGYLYFHFMISLLAFSWENHIYKHKICQKTG